MKQKLLIIFAAIMAVMLPTLALAEPSIPSIDWSSLIPDVATAFSSMVSDFISEVDPIIIAGLSVTIALIGVGLIRKFLSKAGGR